MSAPDEPIERWTANRRAALILRRAKGQPPVAEAAQQHGLTVAEFESLHNQLLLAAGNGLRRRCRKEEALNKR